MSKVTIKPEVVSNLYKTLSVFRNNANKIRFLIGINKLGDGLASKAIIVNGGSMAEIGFKTSLPEEEISIEQGKPWASFILSASDVCSHFSVLESYGADIEVSFNGAFVTFSIGDTVNISLNTVSLETAEPLLPHDYDSSLVHVEANSTFLSSLIRGGFLADTEPDFRHVLDRIALKFVDGKCYSYSTNGTCIAKSWCNVNMRLNTLECANAFLNEKEATLDENGKQALRNKMESLKGDSSGILTFAKTEGFDENNRVMVSLPIPALTAMQKLFGNEEKLSLIVTHNYIHIQSRNMLTTFALAGETTSLYERAVDEWENNAWSSKIVVDKEALLRNLNLLKLGGDKIPVKLSYDSVGFSLSKENAIVHNTTIASQGELNELSIHLRIDNIIACVSKLSAGNIIIRFVSGSSAAKVPISISNGDLTENVSCYMYIIPVVDADTSEEQKTDSK